MTITTQAADSNTDQPKERQLSPDQRTEWGDNIVFEEPGAKNEGTSIENKGTASADLKAAQGETEDKEKDKEADPKPQQVEDEVEDTVEPVVTVEDPGEYTPADYSFNVTVYTGEEGKERPKVIKVTSVEQAESLLEEDPNFGSAKNLLDFNRKLAKMENGLERDQSEHQKKKDVYESQVDLQSERDKYIESITKGIDYLVSKGKLPPISDPEAKRRWSTEQNAWQDKELVKQPGIKEQIDLLDYITKENKARDKAGIARITATEAFTEMQLEAKSSESAQANQVAAQKRKEAGARVAGSSPAPITGAAPKGIAVGRVSGAGLRGLGGDQWQQ